MSASARVQNPLPLMTKHEHHILESGSGSCSSEAWEPNKSAAAYVSAPQQSTDTTTEDPKIVTLIEKPYAWALKSSSSSRSNYVKSRCHNCTAKAKNPCASCNFINYCSPECEKADAAMHELECKGLQTADTTAMSDRHARLIGRILARNNRDGGYLPGSDWHGMEPRCLEDLMAHTKEIIEEEETEAEFQRILGNYRLLFRSVPSLAEVADERVREIYGKIITNAFSICDYDLSTGTMSVGTGLFINCSRFDHSCKAILQYDFEGPTMLMKSKFAITSQTPLFTKYIGSGSHRFGVAFTSERREALLNSYWFHCECDFCNDADRDLLMRNSLSCVCSYKSCRAETVVVLDSGDGLQCLTCKRIVDTNKDKAKILLEILGNIQTVISKCQKIDDGEEDWEEEETQSEGDSESSGEISRRKKKRERFTRGMAVAKARRATKLAQNIFHQTKNVYILRLFELLTDMWANIALDYEKEVDVLDGSPVEGSPSWLKFVDAVKRSVRYGDHCVRCYNHYLSTNSMWKTAQHYQSADLLRRCRRFKDAIQYYTAAKAIWYKAFDGNHKCVQKLNKKIRKCHEEDDRVASQKAVSIKTIDLQN